MGWGQEELNEEIPSCPQWSTPATHLLDTCRLPQEYSDAPKTQAKLHSARKEVKDLVAGIEQPLLWAVKVATEAELAAEAREYNVEEKVQMEQDMRSTTTLQVSDMMKKVDKEDKGGKRRIQVKHLGLLCAEKCGKRLLKVKVWAIVKVTNWDAKIQNPLERE